MIHFLPKGFTHHSQWRAGTMKASDFLFSVEAQPVYEEVHALWHVGFVCQNDALCFGFRIRSFGIVLGHRDPSRDVERLRT